MLIQKAGEVNGTLPPPGFVTPQWNILAQQPAWSKDFPVSTVTIGPATISIGHDDIEADDLRKDLDTRDHEFGWDNESPKRDVQIVKAVKVEDRPVLNGEYYAFWLKKAEPKGELPALWVEDAGEIKVRRQLRLLSLCQVHCNGIGSNCLWLRPDVRREELAVHRVIRRAR